MTCQKLESWWSDAGTFDSLLKASTLVANKKLCVCPSKKLEPLPTVSTFVSASGEYGGELKHSER